jgi:DNA-binding LacI/PurR family transcriptional regulator
VSHVLLGTGGSRVGVSAATADRIRKIAEELNYRPNHAARQLKGKQSRAVGIIISSAFNAGHSQILEGAERVLESNDHLALIGHTHDQAKLRDKYYQDFADRHVDGVICLSVTPEDTLDKLSRLLSIHPTTVFYPCSWPIPLNCHSVDVDRASPATMAVRHLVDCGRRRIGLVLWADNPSDRARRAGYVTGLRSCGLEHDPKLIHVHGHWSAEPPSADAVERAVDVLVVKQQVDAIVAFEDSWAIGLIKHLHRRSVRVPDDVAVMGIENIPADTMIEPELSTVDPRYHRVGEEAAKMLLRIIASGPLDPADRHVVIQPRLVLRESA